MKSTKKELNMKELEDQLEKDEQIQFLFIYNWTEKYKDRGEYGFCKNGHPVFISNYMGFEPNVHVKIQCEECDQVVFEYKPFAVRKRDLNY